MFLFQCFNPNKSLSISYLISNCRLQLVRADDVVLPDRGGWLLVLAASCRVNTELARKRVVKVTRPVSRTTVAVAAEVYLLKINPR